MFRTSFKEIGFLVLSSGLTALAVRLFFVEYSLTPGGITGMAIILSSLLRLSVDFISLCISVPLLMISFFVLGNKFVFKTILITVMIPLFLRMIPQIHVVNHILIASIFGGILVGISISIAIRERCATGGTDTIAYLIQKMNHRWKLSKIIFMIDMIIVIFSCVISKQFYTSFFSAISLGIIVMTIKLLTTNKVAKSTLPSIRH